MSCRIFAFGYKSSSIVSITTISKRTVDALSVEDRDAVFWDDRLPGFGVRVYPSGSKVYVVQTRHDGKSRRVTLGRHGVITADTARREAALVINRIKTGEDPYGKAKSVTVAELAARYMAEHVECRACRGALQGAAGEHAEDVPERA